MLTEFALVQFKGNMSTSSFRELVLPFVLFFYRYNKKILLYHYSSLLVIEQKDEYFPGYNRWKAGKAQ